MVVGGKLFKRICRGPLSQEEASVGWILGEGSQIRHVFLKEWSMSTTFPWLLFIFLFQIIVELRSPFMENVKTGRGTVSNKCKYPVQSGANRLMLSRISRWTWSDES